MGVEWQLLASCLGQGKGSWWLGVELLLAGGIWVNSRHWLQHSPLL